MKRTKAQIKIMPSGKVLDGYTFEDAPGLAVHKLIGFSWRVTHIPTGLRLNDLYPNTLKEGMAMVEQLSKGLDWSNDQQVSEDERYIIRLAEVLSKHLPLDLLGLKGLDFNPEGLGLMCEVCGSLNVAARWKKDNFCSSCLEDGYALVMGFPQKALEIYYILQRGESNK